jgi:tetratricopeptide (TPR) repeat protein
MRCKTSTVGKMIAGLLLLQAVGCSNLSALERGRDAAAAGDDVLAEKLFREAMGSGKDAEEARHHLETLLMERAEELTSEDPSHARDVYRAILDFHPESVQARLGLGRLLMRSKDYEEALLVLDEGDDQAGCRSLTSVVYEKRANDRIEAGDLKGAEKDLDQALALRDDPRLILAKVRIYTVGGGGSAEAAIKALRQAHRKLDLSSTAQVAEYANARRDLALAAARQSDLAGIEGTLALPISRPDLGERDQLLVEYDLRLAVAAQQIAIDAYDEGMRRGAEVLAEAQGTGDEAAVAHVKGGFVDLFAQHAAFQIADGNRKAISTIRAGLNIDPHHQVLQLQQVIATAMRSTKRASRLLEDLPEDEPGRNRLQALLLTVRVHKLIEIGQLTAARAVLDRAENTAADLLEVRLASAELLSKTRFRGLTRSAAEEFRRIGAFRYPGGRINHYGEALAELDWIRRYYDEKAQKHPLRGPEFASRLEALEKEIRAFYPYDVKYAGDASAVLTLRRAGGDPIEVEIALARNPQQKLAIPGSGDASVAFDEQGFVHLSAPDLELGLFVESYAAITAEI